MAMDALEDRKLLAFLPATKSLKMLALALVKASIQALQNLDEDFIYPSTWNHFWVLTLSGRFYKNRKPQSQSPSA